MDPFVYSFRFCCDPDFNDAFEISSLQRYVEEAKIDDVAVFCNVEEINTGHMSFQEQERYLKLLEDVRAALPEEVGVSVNHWHSLMHLDLGKTMPPDMPFRPMVDRDGRVSAACVCPMGELWQTYFCKLYARYAALHPHIIWVEDDFRLHNHYPLRWGGCFCEEHMAEYSRRIGHPVTREEFVEGVLRPGQPHPYRKVWLDVNRETMAALARRIGEAVHRVSPKTRVGLMSSVPHVHAAEGRDWQGILRGFAGDTPPVSRIHLPAYREEVAWKYQAAFNMVSMANRALVPPDTLVYPELENYPYSRFTKSLRFTRFQLLSSLPLDLAGMTIDLYDLNGNGIVWEEGYQDTLRDTKPYLNLLNAMGAFRGEKLGVSVLLSETASYTIHTTKGEEMEELYPAETFFAGYLSANGVPFQYATEVPAGGVAAVSGQYLRNLAPEELERLFADCFVLLTGDALETLVDLGRGDLAGVRGLSWMEETEGDYTFEQVTNEKTYCGIPVARASAVLLSSDAVDVDYQEGAEEFTAFYDSFRRRRAPGHVVSRNTMIFPFGHIGARSDIPQMFLNSLRRDLLHEILLRRARLDAPVVLKNAYVQPYCTRQGNTLYIYLVNAGADDQREIQLRLGEGRARLTLLYSDGREETMETEGGRVTIPGPLASMETVLITVSPMN